MEKELGEKKKKKKKKKKKCVHVYVHKIFFIRVIYLKCLESKAIFNPLYNYYFVAFTFMLNTSLIFHIFNTTKDSNEMLKSFSPS